MSERDEARALLRELLPELLGEVIGATRTNGHANGHRPVPPPAPAVPAVPAPPVPAVLRPSTWREPAAPGEVVGDGATPSAASATPSTPSAAPPRGRVETVVIDTDEDLDAFVRGLLARFENPRDRMAIRGGHLRFALRRRNEGAGGASGGDAMRIERGAVTERAVKRAAESGSRIVLAPGAVLTPLARERARALKVEIEREPRC